MDHGKPRGPNRIRTEAETIDLGNEPPLSVDGGSGGIVDRRRVSVQWFSGTVLTGIFGAALMGGAVFTALDGETNFATMPERPETPLRPGFGANGERASLIRKSDRLPPVTESAAARHTFRLSTTSRVGDREIVRARPYVRIAANLSLTPTELTASLPPFNAQRLLAAAGTEGAGDESPGAEPDAEVSFVTRDLAELLPKAKVNAVVGIDDIVMRVRDLANSNALIQARAVAGENVAVNQFASINEADIGQAGSSFRPRIFPENISFVPKTASQITGGNTWNERTIVVKKTDSMASILQDLGATPDEIKVITAAAGPRGRDGGLKEGQKLRVLLTATGMPPRPQPIRVIVQGDSAVEAIVALSDKGKYVAADVRSMNTETTETREADDGNGMRLYQSIYETALRYQIPRPVIESLVRIYSYDVDYYYKTQPGDSVDVLYTGEDEASGAGDSKNEVVFASITVGGETKKFYRYQTPDDGVIDYYDETGKSAKKFLVRKPLAQGIFRSGFGERNHPLLNVMKAHTGVDWGAPLGTPIYASGNGIVEKAGWESGYGKYIRLRHANGYETAYGHMTAFARNIAPGVRVRQGQVIGYVGSTGLSTGPHLHYEILINGRWVDPMRLKLPRGRVLDGPILAAFEQERERIDRMIQRSGSRLAQSPPLQSESASIDSPGFAQAATVPVPLRRR